MFLLRLDQLPYFVFEILNVRGEFPVIDLVLSSTAMTLKPIIQFLSEKNRLELCFFKTFRNKTTIQRMFQEILKYNL